VLREVEMAFNAGKPLLPVHLTTVALSPNLNYFLSTRQWFDAGDAFDSDDTDRVVRSLRQLLAGPSADPARLGPDRDPSSARAMRSGYRLIAAAIALALLAAVGVYFMTRSARPSPPPTGPAAGGVPTSPPGASAAVANDSVAAAVANDSAAAASGRSPATSVVASPRGRGSRVNAADGQTYVLIPAGEFTMGCSVGDPSCDSDEGPPHQVTIARSFWLASTEVTGAQYRKVRPRGGEGSAVTPDAPITEVTRAQAKAYCKEIGGRLPREAEWEYAARGGTTTRAYGPLSAIGWFAANSEAHAHPVGRLQPNRFGLFDMLGNVHEWVLDRYFNSYGNEDDDAASIEPVAPNASATVRGGAWSSEPTGMRASARLERPPDATDPNIGFRCAID
jgi:formylglycine-generating enzyme required for sulfatase activity